MEIHAGTFIVMKASYARSKSKFFVRNTRVTDVHCCIINQNSVMKMTRIHENFIPQNFYLYKKEVFHKNFLHQKFGAIWYMGMVLYSNKAHCESLQKNTKVMLYLSDRHCIVANIKILCKSVSVQLSLILVYTLISSLN